MRRVWWKKNEIKFLLENYQSMYTGEISRVLDRSISGIETKMRDLKISPKSDAVYKRFTKKQLNFITKNSTIMPSADIAIALHRDAKGVRNKMVSMGLSPLSKIFYWDSKKDDILKQNRLLPYEELMGMVGCQRRTLQARMKKLKLQKFRNKSLQSSVEITCPHCLTPYPKTSDFFYFKDNGELWSSLCKNCARLRIVNYNSRLPSYIAMLLRGISCDIKRRHKRGMEMNIDREYILSLYEKQGGLCAITGIKMQFKQGYNFFSL